MISTPSTLRLPANREFAVKALRLATRYLRSLADSAETVIGVAMVATLVASWWHIGPQWAQLSTGWLLVAVLAAIGGSQIVTGVLSGLADLTDPDVRDGDSVHVAAVVLKELSDDLRDGAAYYDVLKAVRVSGVVAEMETFLTELATAYTEDGEQDQGAVISKAAQYVRDARRELAHQD